MSKDIKYTKICCEHCGCVFDPNQNSTCPKCGAAYDTNKHIKKCNELRDEMNEITVETAKAELESIKIDNIRKKKEINTPNNNQTTKKNTKIIIWVILIPLLMFIGSIIVSLIEFSYTTMETIAEQNIVVETTEPPIVEVPITVTFNEEAELIQYAVICDEAEEYIYPWRDPQEGFYYIRLHLIATNKTEERRFVPDEMICQYEKNGHKISAIRNTISSDDFSTKIDGNGIDKMSSTEGWTYFEVPLDTDLILLYDDFVTINIPSKNVKMVEKD